MVYTGEHLREISFPMGGIGTGSIGLAGNGCFVDWEIFNRPNKGSLNKYSCFAVKADFPDGKSVTKILQGDWQRDLSGQYTRTPYEGFGVGPDSGTLCGFPHFKKVKFDGKFPIATLTFEDDGFPAKVVMKAFNPFIPLDADNSSIPAAFFDIAVHSRVDGVKYTVILSIRNPFASTVNEKCASSKYTAITMKHAGVSHDCVQYGDLTVAVDDPDGIYQEYWYRGLGREAATTFWYDLTHDCFHNRRYNESGKEDTCSVGSAAVISAKKNHHFRFVLSWNVPNCYTYWDSRKDENGNDIIWKNYYASLFADSAASCFYSLEHWNKLYTQTEKFCRSLHTATLDKAVIDAVSANLSVLKSPTVLRLEDGTFYGWEGTHETDGSCEGTTTHVWSYVYATCFLFPELERSLRDTEFRYNTDENGFMQFRTKLPIGYGRVDFHPCVDGQMATVFKIYRDWKLTGNSQWLAENWENIKKILEFAWSKHNSYEWDADHDGVLEGRQHHTLDMELFGPSSWLQGMYLAALKAAAEIADFLGYPDKKQEYTELFESGYQWTKDNLFNGEYFIHKVDLENKAYTEHFDCPEYWNEEKHQLKYQIGDGCEIDQILGQWHANLCGLGDIFDKEQRKTALKSMFKYIYKPTLRDYANLWRVFALNDEGGSIMCDYPEGSQKPVIPIRYCEECMTGFEYSFAGLLISEGFIEEGLTVIRAVRERYDGKKRNPWNEIECGGNYARTMASFALLPIFSGFTFDIPNNHIGFSPILPGAFKCFWSVGSGWGDVIKTDGKYTVTVNSGTLTLKSISLGGIAGVKKVLVDGKQIPFTQNADTLTFEAVTAKKSFCFEV